MRKVKILERHSDEIEIMRAAMQWLAQRCDYATSLDGQGFSGADSILGHALAEKDTWGEREAWAASLMLKKYGGQLAQEGGFDQSKWEAAAKALSKRYAGAKRMARRDIVEGEIWVEGDQVLFSTDYHRDIVDELRELVNARFDGDTKIWRGDLCAENADIADRLANQFGLKIKNRGDLADAKTARKVEVTEEHLVFRGTKWWLFAQESQLEGKPEVDEAEFSAWTPIDNGTSMGVPLRSWTLRGLMLWFQSKDPEQDLSRKRLDWAAEDCKRIIEQLYPRLLEQERENTIQAGAVEPQVGEKHKRARADLAARIPPRMAKRLMPHQWAGLEALVSNSQVLLADEQGLGKTIEVLATLEATDAFPAIVVAPATALLNWRDEISDWLPDRQVAVRGGKVAKGDQGADLAQADIVILNYEAFGKARADLMQLSPKSIVLDEAQYLKGHKSKRTENVVGFTRYDVNRSLERVIAATGTPVLNRPAELLTLSTLLPDLLADLGGFRYFAARYCRATVHQSGWATWWDFDGAANLDELGQRLRETGRFIRREKSDVLTRMAPKRREYVQVEIENAEEYRQAAEDFSRWLRENASRRPSRGRRPSKGARKIRAVAEALGLDDEAASSLYLDGDASTNALQRMTALRKLVAQGKIQPAIACVKDLVKDEKLVVFAHHIEVQEKLAEALAEHHPLTITGAMTARARHMAIRSFQHDPERRIIICSLKASQTAITLTAAHRALVVELDWTPANLEQAEDRLHRIGQTGEVKVTYLVANGTIDDHISQILQAKLKHIRALGNGAHKRAGKAKPAAASSRRGRSGEARASTTAGHKPKPGPGRPPLDPLERARRRAICKSVWQAKNLEYMRNYMRQRRRDIKAERDREQPT